MARKERFGIMKFFKPKSDKNDVNDVSSEESLWDFQYDVANRVKVWKKEILPTRTLKFFGWDKHGEPSYLIFYALHNGKQIDSEEDEVSYILDESIVYKHYLIVHGKNGHLPKIEQYFAADEYENWGDKEKTFNIYRKQRRGENFYWSLNKEARIKDLTSLSKGEIAIPFYKAFTYEQLLLRVQGQLQDSVSFIFAKTPNAILKLEESEAQIYKKMVRIYLKDRAYTKKKILSEIFKMDIDPETLEKILLTADDSFLGGLLLEGARQKDERFLTGIYFIKNYLEEAEELSSSQAGVLRCLSIYENVFDEKKRALRIEHMEKEVDGLALNFNVINKKTIDSDKVLEGAFLRKAACKGQLNSRQYVYEQDENGRWRGSYETMSNLMHPNYFNNGYEVFEPRIKHMIQEAEIYENMNVLGKIAYYLDSPNAFNYFSGNGRGKALRYYQKYLRRVFEGLAMTNEALYCEAMIQLFSMYREEDYLCKFKGNFQFNYFIRHILYGNLPWKVPKGDYYFDSKRHHFLANDQLMLATKPMMKHMDVWKNNIHMAYYIYNSTGVESIGYACYLLIESVGTKAHFYNKYDILELLMMWDCDSPQLEKFIQPVIDKRLKKQKEGTYQILLNIITSSKYDHLLEKNQDQMTLFCGSVCGMIKKDMKVYDQVISKLLKFIQREDYLGQHKFKKNLTEKLMFQYPYHQMNERLRETCFETSLKDDLGMYLTYIRTHQLPSNEFIKSLYLSEEPMKISAYSEMISHMELLINEKNDSLLALFESQLLSLERLAKKCFKEKSNKQKEEIFEWLVTSTYELPVNFAVTLLKNNEMVMRPEWLLTFMEHPNAEIQKQAIQFLSEQESLSYSAENFARSFIHVVRSILFVPNKHITAKRHIYKLIPPFLAQYPMHQEALEEVLLEIGHSGCIADSERALITYMEIKG